MCSFDIRCSVQKVAELPESRKAYVFNFIWSLLLLFTWTGTTERAQSFLPAPICPQDLEVAGCPQSLPIGGCSASLLVICWFAIWMWFLTCHMSGAFCSPCSCVLLQDILNRLNILRSIFALFDFFLKLEHCESVYIPLQNPQCTGWANWSILVAKFPVDLGLGLLREPNTGSE